MAIPKIIHYCWYSGEPKDERTLQCIESWHKHMPDWEFMEWTASNCNIDETEFTRTAFEAKKWAQVADYFRLKVLYEHGGIYLDADVLVNKPFDEFLKYDAFFPIETIDHVINAVMGAAPKNEVIRELMKPYVSAEKHIGHDHTLSLMHYMGEYLSDVYGYRKTGFTQMLKNNIAVFAPNILMIDVGDGQNVCEHLFAASWLDDDQRQKDGSTHKFYVLLMYFFCLFGRPVTRYTHFLAPANEEQPQSKDFYNEISGLIDTVHMGLDYMLANPNNRGVLVNDISDAISAIASQLAIYDPPALAPESNDYLALRKWLQDAAVHLEIHCKDK